MQLNPHMTDPDRRNSPKFESLALKERLYQRRFLVPNAITVANMFCGFLAIVYASASQFDKAVLALGIGILLDGLDGRIARSLNATSKFGVEFDSLADLVSFGIAPAILMYHWCFRPLANEFGVMVCFVFALCSASRLARFNVNDKSIKTFMGLPTPGAAGFVAAMVHCFPSPEGSWPSTIFGALVMLMISFLMVSRIEYFSPKVLQMKHLGWAGRIVIGLTIALLWYSSRVGLLTLAAAYCASGPFQLLFRRAGGGGVKAATKGKEVEKFAEL